MEIEITVTVTGWPTPWDETNHAAKQALTDDAVRGGLEFGKIIALGGPTERWNGPVSTLTWKMQVIPHNEH